MPTKTTRQKRTAARRSGARSPAPAGTGAARSLRDKAYETIKHRIITCAFRPGEYINELQLSALLKIGRTPVHQATRSGRDSRPKRGATPTSPRLPTFSIERNIRVPSATSRN
jgi:hypothetical protein